MIIFLSCVKMKNGKECKAKDMYISPLFKKSLSYAKSLNPDKIFILSAKYGVLELDDIIKPYNLTLNDMKEKEKKNWAYNCYIKLKEKDVDFSEKTVFLCGKNYRKYLSKCFKNNECPIENLSLGNQLSFYGRIKNVLY